MNNESIFDAESILKNNAEPSKILAEINQAIAIMLQADRCFLYVRDSETRYGQAAFCYCRNSEVEDVSSSEWIKEQPADLEEKDPMFAAALKCKPSIYVEDIEAADPEIVNRDFEVKEFGHRALIHVHLCQEDKLWGIWQPSVFGQPRIWTAEDRQIIEAIAFHLTPLVKQYVQDNFNPSRRKIIK